MSVLSTRSTRYSSYEDSSDLNASNSKYEKIKIGVVTGCALAFIAFAASRYRVAGPTEYIVRTGAWIKDISITKKAFQLPFQTYHTLSLEPATFSVEVDAMSQQRIPFKMPSVWTIGPADNPVALTNYARLLMGKGKDGLQSTVEGIIQGETRILTANMDLDSIFRDRNAFKTSVTENINKTLEDFGLTVYNANIAELSDLDDHNPYFSEQKKRALQKVNQEARVHVAEAMREGESGEKLNQAQTRQQISLYEKEAKLVENERTKEILESNKNLAVAQALFKQEQDIATVEALAAAEKRKWHLQQEVERQRKEQELERLRAGEGASALIHAEITKIKAEAEFFAKQKEAEGILAIKKAEAEGLRQLIDAAGNEETLSKYLLISQRQLPELAEKQAQAIQGLQPKINVWSTGGLSNGSLSSTLTDFFKTGMPLLEGIKHQTGYDFLQSAGIKQVKD